MGLPASGSLNPDTCPPIDIYGPIILQHVPVVPQKSLASLMAALDKRCNYRTDARCHTDILAASFDLLDAVCPEPMAPLDWTMDRFRDWNSQFPVAKQKRQERAAELISQITRRDFSDKTVFVKMEALLKRHDPNWAPRIVNQSSDLHNTLLGPIMQACTRRMFECFDRRRGLGVLELTGAYKKKSEEIVAHMNAYGDHDSVFLSADFSSNDSSQVKDVHMLEVAWMRRLGAPVWITGLMLHANSYTITNRSYRVKMRIENQLPTGAQSTTFRNTMWNATIVNAFCRFVQRWGAACLLGDDAVLRIDGATGTMRFYRRTYEHVARLARMDVKVTTRKTLEGCTFLSRYFVCLPRGYVMVPFLGKALARFNVCPNSYLPRPAYLAGKALSYAYEFRHFKSISDLYLAKFGLLHKSGELDLSGVSWNVRGLFLRYGMSGLLAEIGRPSITGSLSDFTGFIHVLAGLTASDYYLATCHMLFSEGDIDNHGLAFLDAEWVG
jgi:hypothetical protein